MSSINEKKVATDMDAAALFVNALATDNYRVAARIAWPWYAQNEWSNRIWNAIEKHDRLCIMGHAAASKTFTASIWYLLDWIAHAQETALILTSATIGSMEARIWGDFKILWSKSRIDLSSIASILDAKRLIRQSITDGKAAVHALAAESDDAETKIQGLHMPRMRVIFDEADNPYSSSIWPALTNLGSSGHLKVVALANPSDKNSEFGFHCEPVDGWDTIDPEHHFEWESKMGWHVLRLDGLESPNVKAGSDVYPYLLTNKSIAQTRDEQGTNSPAWWTMVRAFYPPEGLVATIFPGGLISKCTKPIVWYGLTTPIASCDPAFEGGDSCVVTLGKMGRLASHPERTGVEVDSFHKIKRKDLTASLSFDFADQITGLLKSHGVAPRFFSIDTTGNQGSFADIIEQKLGKGLLRVNFSQGASNRKITAEDTGPASERYKTFVTELWYSAREWCRLGLVSFNKTIPRDLRIQLESRRYILKGRHAKSGRDMIMAEPKTDMKSRGLGSPDEGDAFCLLIHLARHHAAGFTPGSFSDHRPGQSKKNFFKNATVWTQDYGVPDAD